MQTLLIKDLRLLLSDFKFQIFFVLLIVLFILAAISGSVTYHAYSKEYQASLNEHIKNTNDESSYSLRSIISGQYKISVIDVPSPALLFNNYEYYHNKLTNLSMIYRPTFGRYGAVGSEVFQLDWNFILGILTGFIMLIMSFEAVSNEKRAGTLRLLSINGYKRQTVLWCKYLSYLILYLIIIIPPALISMILFFAFTGTWEISYMLKFLVIIVLSIPFASFFILLGIFISMAKNYRSSIVLIISIWLLFVIIIPQSANIFGKQLSPIKTITEYSQGINKAWMTEYDYQNKMADEAIDRGEETEPANRMATIINSADEKRNVLELQRLEDNKKQLRTVENITSISPFTQYEKISEIVFDKGFYLQGFQQETMKNTITQIKNLIIEQDSRDDKSLHAFYSQAGGVNYYREDQKISFSEQKFDHPNLLFVTNIPTDDTLGKIMKITKWLIPILTLNLLLIISSVIKLEKLDIR